ncbi:MAG: iron uptake porin [Symploca sp. SIO2B6]|nr:iron uptake porin [Symploca sp. SIO2B6]
MLTISCKSWWLSPAILGAILWTTGAIATETNSVELEIAQANISNGPPIANTSQDSTLEQIRRYSRGSRQKSLNQVTNVSQLRDVSPGDWAFEALRSLVERYGCIAGYPDGTFRGNRPLTRYEFAAGLNACLDQITRLLASDNGGSSEDLERLQRLMREFEAELATLGTRVDGLEGRVAFLEDNQFSTTTKLEGEVIFGLASVFNGEDVNGDDVDQVAVFGDRVRLELNTSFTGQDLLFTRLATGNFPEFAEETGTFEGEIGFAQPEDNDVAVEVLYYQFPFGDNTEVSIFATGGAADDFADTLNILDGDGGSGAVSLFGTRNPIYYTVEGAGLGFKTALSNTFELSGGYLASNDEVNNPSDGSGLFNGPYSALGQLVFKPNDSLSIGLTYVHSYRQNDTGTGSRLANFQSTLEEFFDTDVANQTVGDFLTDLGFSTDIPVISNSYGIELSWRLSEQFVIGGWGGYTFSDTLSTGNGLINRGTIETLNFALTLGFPDLGKEGNLGGIIVGVEPYVVDSSVNQVNPLAAANLALAGLTEDDLPIGEDDDISFHVEAFYQYQLTDNIAITPGVIWITAPNNDEDNDDLVIGTIRTTFSF